MCGKFATTFAAGAFWSSGHQLNMSNPEADHLRSNRMVKTRLGQWKLNKRSHCSKRRATSKTLGPDPRLLPSENSQLSLQDSAMTYEESLGSPRRHGICGPLQPFLGIPDNDTARDAHTNLRTAADNPGDVGSNDDHVSRDNHRGFEVAKVQESRDWSPPQLKRDSAPGRTGFGRQSLQGASLQHIRDPDAFSQIARAVDRTRLFCWSYLAQCGTLADAEPAIHHHTNHARFQDQIHAGLALFPKAMQGQVSLNIPFHHFGLACGLLKEVFADVHPMAVALYLDVLCQLRAQKVGSVAAELLRHTIALAASTPTILPSLFELLKIMQEPDGLVELPLACLRAAINAFQDFEDSSVHQWKTLYLQERHCDALYHAGMYGEGAAKRVQLLEAQEAFYGRSARNVIWTLSNVADDHLRRGDLDAAEQSFSNVLDRSRVQHGFNQAKTSVVAHEGLAKVYLARANDAQATARPQAVGKAFEHSRQALELAQTWFESKRRIDRVRHLRNEIRSLNSDSAMA